MKLLGIDVGATKVAAGIVDTESGEILERRRVPTARDGRTVLDDCVGLARELEAPGGGAGIGICELVSPDGRVTSAASVDWRGLDLDQAFGEFGPVTVESDVRAAAAAEARHGAGRGESSMLFVGVGSGVSHTLVVDGRPLVGAHGEAIIFGAPPAEEVGSGLRSPGSPARSRPRRCWRILRAAIWSRRALGGSARCSQRSPTRWTRRSS